MNKENKGFYSYFNDALKQHSGVNNDDEDGVDIPGMNS